MAKASKKKHHPSSHHHTNHHHAGHHPKKTSPRTGPLESSVAITNLDSGESIPLTFDLTVTCSNNSGGPMTLSATCTGATVWPASVPVPDGGSLTNEIFTLTHTAASTGHTVTATLQGTGTPFTDNASDITVTDNSQLTINPTAPSDSPNDVPSLDPTAQLGGTLSTNPTSGELIVAVVQTPTTISESLRASSRKKNHPRQRSIFALTPTSKNWQFPAFTAANRPDSGSHVRVFKVKQGKIRAIVRGKFQ